MVIKRSVEKAVVLFVIGGMVYALVELLWRGHTHWTMMIAGGLCFLIIGGINEWFTWTMPLLLQGVIGSAVITVVELVFGLVLNVWLGLGIWDYSDMPLHFMGQICLPFALLWVPLAIVAVVLDDQLRYRWFGEERPTYTLL